MKDKVIEWLFEKVLNTNKEKVLSFIYRLVKIHYEDSVNTKEADRELNENIFNAKYTGAMRDGLTPGEVLQDFYERAGKGDRSFLLHYFHAIMRMSGDKHVGKLNYKLKRNSN